VKVLNQFATIYTAGTRLADPTMGGTFDVPKPSMVGSQRVTSRGPGKSRLPCQFSLAGGNVTINAQGDIIHQTSISGTLVDDSERELPMNWLYRRGYVDPQTGIRFHQRRLQSKQIRKQRLHFLVGGLQ